GTKGSNTASGISGTAAGAAEQAFFSAAKTANRSASAASANAPPHPDKPENGRKPMTFQGHNNRKKAGGYAEYITGGELRLLQQTACRFKAALETAAWKHYVRAIKESEPVPDAEARRKRKKQAA
ncbi:hypothetical protein FG024_002170, partial [Neisseria gonorrhoeae]